MSILWVLQRGRLALILVCISAATVPAALVCLLLLHAREWRPPDVKAGPRYVELRRGLTGDRKPQYLSWTEYERLGARPDVFDLIAGVATQPIRAVVNGVARETRLAFVGSSYDSIFHIAPTEGEWLPATLADAGPFPVVLTHAFASQTSSAPLHVGSLIQVGEGSARVVGIMDGSPGAGLDVVDGWAPLDVLGGGSEWPGLATGRLRLTVSAVLKPGVAVEELERALAEISDAPRPGTPAIRTVRGLPAALFELGQLGAALRVSAVLSGLALLSALVASTLVVRHSARWHTAILVACASPLSAVAVAMLLFELDGSIPLHSELRRAPLGIMPIAQLFLALVALFAMPAAAAMTTGRRDGRAMRGITEWLLIGSAAGSAAASSIAWVICVGGHNLAAQYDLPDRTLLADMAWEPARGSDQRSAILSLGRVGKVGWAASGSPIVPLSAVARRAVRVFGRMSSPERLDSSWREITPGYFAVLGKNLVRGRDFDEADVTAVPQVAIISESIERAWWPAGDSLGKQIQIIGEPFGRHIVGVAADAKGTAATDAVFVPLHLDQPRQTVSLAVRSIDRATERADHRLALVEQLRRITGLAHWEDPSEQWRRREMTTVATSVFAAAVAIMALSLANVSLSASGVAHRTAVRMCVSAAWMTLICLVAATKWTRVNLFGDMGGSYAANLMGAPVIVALIWTILLNCGRGKPASDPAVVQDPFFSSRNVAS